MESLPEDILEKVLKIKTVKNMEDLLKSKWAKSEIDFYPEKKILAHNKMDKTPYIYTLEAAYGNVISESFKPQFSPAEMLKMGVFEGKYLNDCVLEFPKSWFEEAIKNNTLSPGEPNIMCNYFKIKSRLSLEDWIAKEWIELNQNAPDNRGWFQWYCRYYIGRRIPSVDCKQIKRWGAFIRHVAQVKKNCHSMEQRPRQRQALLQWSHNCFVGIN